jgi:hypothetical protein
MRSRNNIRGKKEKIEKKKKRKEGGMIEFEMFLGG